jgi:hypothetical protein
MKNVLSVKLVSNQLKENTQKHSEVFSAYNAQHALPTNNLSSLSRLHQMKDYVRSAPSCESKIHRAKLLKIKKERKEKKENVVIIIVDVVDVVDVVAVDVVVGVGNNYNSAIVFCNSFCICC